MSQYSTFFVFLFFSIELFWSVLCWCTCSFRYLSLSLCPVSLTDAHTISFFLSLTHTQILTHLSASPWLVFSFSVITGFLSTSCVTCCSHWPLPCFLLYHFSVTVSPYSTRQRRGHTICCFAGLDQEEGRKKGKLRYKVWVLACVAGWWMGVCVCPAVVKFGLIIHVEAVALLPKLANETPSCLGTHTGHSDQLLNENAQVSKAALARALLQIPAVHRHSYKTECTTAFFQLLGKVCHLCSLRTHQTFKWLSQL